MPHVFQRTQVDPCAYCRRDRPQDSLLLCQGPVQISSLPCPEGALVYLPRDAVLSLQTSHPTAAALTLPAGTHTLGDIPLLARISTEAEERFLGSALVLLDGASWEEVSQALLGAVTAWLRAGAAPDRSRTAPTHPQMLIARTQTYIRQHYSDDISLQKVADELFVNPCYLSRIFSEGTGTSFNRYLRTVRLERARELLIETNRLIGDIAAMTGFSSSSHLGSCFRQEYGMTPNRFRSTNRKTWIKENLDLGGEQ